MQLVQRADVTGADADALWTLYSRAFGRRRRNRPGSPTPIPRDRFDVVMQDLRITKFLVVDPLAGRSVAAFAALGPALGPPGCPAHGPATAAPGGSCDHGTCCRGAPDPRQLLERWPEHLEQGRVWHLGLLAVDPDYRGTSTAVHLVTGVWATAAACGGVITVDLDAVHEVWVHLPTTLYELARTFSPGTRLRSLPGGSCWAYEFPAPLPA